MCFRKLFRVFSIREYLACSSVAWNSGIYKGGAGIQGVAGLYWAFDRDIGRPWLAETKCLTRDKWEAAKVLDTICTAMSVTMSFPAL
jgi:hypothetical protein